MHVLIAEGDPTLSDALERFLRLSGHTVDSAADGESALQLLDTHAFDLLILDHGLPRIGGVEVLRQARRRSVDLAVLLISACDDAANRVRRFGLVIDDFLAKPFGLDSLEASIKRLSRRPKGNAWRAPPVFGPLRCDSASAWLDDNVLALPPRVHSLLQLLIEHSGTVVSSEAIVGRLAVYGPDADPEGVSGCIACLQHQLSRSDRVRLVTVRGLGYCLTEATSECASFGAPA